ncbi:hypothetical protein GJ688_02600 [Heliobacillus mobilis]|uniref:Uncharacterized protein n=1 Tax=Heliobacterium mobile TaxID=28064 RepID=A0A6I3SG70_HELMO|nr:hypothetical protein [Heliobacterium mobile]MTV47874.1 hypothetical protein [Heliobacterium mobile]
MRFTGYNPCENRNWLHHRFVVEMKSREEIAKEIGCKSASVNIWLWRHGIRRTRKFTIHDLVRLHFMKRMSIIEIARHYGVSTDTVVYHFKTQGIKHIPNIKRVDKYATFTKKWFIENYVNTETSIIQLSNCYNVDSVILSNMLKSYGLTVKYHDNVYPERIYNLLRCYHKQKYFDRTLRKFGDKCSKCGTDKDLQMHHKVKMKSMVIDAVNQSGITPYTEDNQNALYDWMKANSKAYNDLNNLEILCGHCHKELHRRQSAAKPPMEEGSTTIEKTLDVGVA